MSAMHACSPQQKPECIDGFLEASWAPSSKLTWLWSMQSEGDRRGRQDINGLVSTQSSLKGSCPTYTCLLNIFWDQPDKFWIKRSFCEMQISNHKVASIQGGQLRQT
eukprot:1146330-Pelagomonas_calceolata.AAC.3